jgi:hypothetical protein
MSLRKDRKVCRVFKLYRDGVSPREIAKLFNQNGIPGPAGVDADIAAAMPGATMLLHQESTSFADEY